jgi:GH25 family lysozyme M1 (1,4-beta-N-acetylmuramidase)
MRHIRQDDDSTRDPFDEGRPDDGQDPKGAELTEPSPADAEALERTVAGKPQGIDVSHWQSLNRAPIDWRQVAASGKRFVYIRCSYSASPDRHAERHWDGAKRAGLLCGGYHFFRYDAPAVAQVEAFLRIFSATRKYRPGSLPPALDLEHDRYGQPLRTADARVAYVRNAREWVQRIEDALAMRPLIYTGPNFWSSIRDPDGLAHLPLWVARLARPFKLPRPWKDHAFWQYDHKGSVPGIAGNVDLNVFNGGDSELIALTT